MPCRAVITSLLVHCLDHANVPDILEIFAVVIRRATAGTERYAVKLVGEAILSCVSGLARVRLRVIFLMTSGPTVSSFPHAMDIQLRSRGKSFGGSEIVLKVVNVHQRADVLVRAIPD